MWFWKNIPNRAFLQEEIIRVKSMYGTKNASHYQNKMFILFFFALDIGQDAKNFETYLRIKEIKEDY